MKKGKKRFFTPFVYVKKQKAGKGGFAAREKLWKTPPAHFPPVCAEFA